jgi:hypothetical protein
MKTIPTDPYINNIAEEYYRVTGNKPWEDSKNFREWAKQFRFKIPLENWDVFQFPDDFSDEELILFILRWS